MEIGPIIKGHVNELLDKNKDMPLVQGYFRRTM